MGSERSSTVRQISSGRICALCRASLPPPHVAGEQLCSACRGVRKRHKIYMSFLRANVWCCEFLEQDLSTQLPKKLTFRSHEKVRELAERGGCALNLETLQALNHGLETGRGGVWLELSEEQYLRLKR